MNPRNATDPATAEVIRHYLVSAATEMERTLVRSAYSTIIYEINDFGLSIFDRNLNLLADATGLPLFLGANEYGIRQALEHSQCGPLEPGDVLFMNVPYWSGAHTNDGVLIAPAFVIIDRFAPALLLPLSLGLYLIALIVHFTAPTWPVEGEWFFNPFTWQAIFVLGFVLSHDRGLGHFVRCNITRIRQIALPLVVLAAIVAWFGLYPDPTRFPEPKMLFLHGKSFLTPVRLLQFLALAAVFSAVYPVIARAVPWITGPLSMLGRNSLQVFCVGSLLSLSGQIIRFLYSGSLAVDTIVVIVGIGLLCLTAWLAEWRQRLGSHG